MLSTRLPLRISMIAAIDNFGDSVISISTSNTDTVTFGSFLFNMVRELQNRDENWRLNTYWLFDNAVYHHEALEAFRKMGLKVIFTGPYMFNVPIEQYFAQLKA